MYTVQPLDGDRPVLAKTIVPPEAKYYPAFDYLRLFCAVAVFLGHSDLLPWPHGANFAVQIFFALSGWLIGGIILRSDIRELPRFYFNRAARIWIPYFIAIMLLMTASLMKDRITGKWFEIFFYNTTFVYNFFGPPQLALYVKEMPLQGTGNHFWSICAEEQFYILAPLLIALLPFRVGRSFPFWICVTVLCMSTRYWEYFGSISFGVLAAVSVSIFGGWHNSSYARFALAVCAAVIFLAMYVDILPYHMVAPVVAILIVLSLSWYGIYSNFGAFIGGISFPLYLNAWIAGFAVNAASRYLGIELHVIGGLVLALSLASIHYFLVDRRVKKYRDRAFSTKRGSAVALFGILSIATGLVVGIKLS